MPSGTAVLWPGGSTAAAKRIDVPPEHQAGCMCTRVVQRAVEGSSPRSASEQNGGSSSWTHVGLFFARGVDVWRPTGAGLDGGDAMCLPCLSNQVTVGSKVRDALDLE